MDLDELIDFANEATQEIAKHTVSVTLVPEKMTTEPDVVDALDWQSIEFGEAELNKVPDNRRGVYAFAVSHNDECLPPHVYILYIGIAGRDSNRSLRARYKDYLNAKKVKKRARIAWMIGTWHDVLRFFFASVPEDLSAEELKALEQHLNTALIPPFSEADLDADTKRRRRAFR